MQKLTVTFTRVFDITRHDPGLLSRDREQRTSFGFENETGKHYNVSVPGLPRVESGMTVTAFLSNRDDWHSLIGWKDHETGDVAGPNRRDSVVIALVLFAATLSAISAMLCSSWYSACLLAIVAIGAATRLAKVSHFNREIKSITVHRAGPSAEER